MKYTCPECGGQLAVAYIGEYTDHRLVGTTSGKPYKRRFKKSEGKAFMVSSVYCTGCGYELTDATGEMKSGLPERYYHMNV